MQHFTTKKQIILTTHRMAQMSLLSKAISLKFCRNILNVTELEIIAKRQYYTSQQKPTKTLVI